jgi:hypothetical protein
LDEIGVAWLGVCWKLHIVSTVAAVWVPMAADLTLMHQLELLYRFQNDLDLNIGLKAFLKVA